MLFQILFTGFVLFAIGSTYQTTKKHAISKRGQFIWLALWIMAIGIVWTPSTVEYIAFQLGIGRGVDIVLYSTIPVLFFLLFRLHIKIATLETKITKIVQHIAVSNSENNNTKKDL